jgi:hypothetical protein
MNRELEKELKKTYNEIKKLFPNVILNSLDVVKQVEVYRQFWKPKNVDVVLSAESHLKPVKYE